MFCRRAFRKTTLEWSKEPYLIMCPLNVKLFFVLSTTPNFTLLFTVIPDHGSTLSASSLLLSGHICRLFGFISQCQSSVKNNTLNIFQLRIRTDSFRWFYEKYVFVVIICCSKIKIVRRGRKPHDLFYLPSYALLKNVALKRQRSK